MSGWVSIERKLWDDPVFAKEPMSEREAFMWLKANAAWKDTTHRVGGEVLDCPRGSLFITLREFQATTSWGSDTKIRNFLQRLEDAGLIERTVRGKRNARKTHVTICGYEEIQADADQKNASETHQERIKNAVKEQGNNKQPSEPKGSSDVGSGSREYGFDDFWQVWPVKDGKQKALTAWKKLNLDDKRAAFSAVRSGWFDKWRASKPDANPIHPASFLNGKRWQDEFTQPQLKPIDGGRNHGKRSVTERLAARGAFLDHGPGGNPSEPFPDESDERGGGGGRDDGLDQGPVGVFPFPNYSRM